MEKVCEITGVLIQGRKDSEFGEEYVKSIKVQWSDDGEFWNDVDSGKEFVTNCGADR